MQNSEDKAVQDKQSSGAYMYAKRRRQTLDMCILVSRLMIIVVATAQKILHTSLYSIILLHTPEARGYFGTTYKWHG